MDDRRHFSVKRIWKDRITAITLILASLYLANQAREFPERGGVFPIFSFAVIILCSAVLFFSTFASKGTPPAAGGKIGQFTWSDSKPYLLVLLTLIMTLLFDLLGYFFTTGLFLIFASLILGTKKYRALSFTAIILLPLLYLFLIHGVGVTLPKGILF
jgi:hypothetical protein